MFTFSLLTNDDLASSELRDVGMGRTENLSLGSSASNAHRANSWEAPCLEITHYGPND
jgi:hypothetical protein